MLFLVLLVAAIQAYTPTNKRVGCMDYSMGRQANAELVAEAVECTGNKATFVGFMCNVKACAAAVQQLGGTLFKWGGDGSGKFTTTKNYRKSKAGWKTTTECWMEEIGAQDCVPQDAQYDVYKVAGGPISQDASVIKKKVECKSGDVNLSEPPKAGVLECAAAVKKNGGKYFIFGRPREGKQYSCWMEKTSSASCPQGWEDDAYDFWQVGGGTFEADHGYTCRGKCAGSRSCHEPSGQCRLRLDQPETSCRGACWNSCCNMKTVRCETCGTFAEGAVGQRMLGGSPASMSPHPVRQVGLNGRPFRAMVGSDPSTWSPAEQNTLAMDTTSRATGPSPIVSGFAALGLAFILFGSYKFYCGKSA